MTIGCSNSNNNLSNNNGSDGGGDAGGMMQSQDLSAGVDLGGPGAACTTACDCTSGLACNNMGLCEQSPQGMIYCCESQACPMNSFCQSQTGDFMMCGGGTGRRDGGFGGRDGGFGGRDGGRPNRDM